MVFVKLSALPALLCAVSAMGAPAIGGYEANLYFPAGSLEGANGGFQPLPYHVGSGDFISTGGLQPLTHYGVSANAFPSSAVAADNFIDVSGGPALDLSKRNFGQNQNINQNINDNQNINAGRFGNRFGGFGDFGGFGGYGGGFGGYGGGFGGFGPGGFGGNSNVNVNSNTNRNGNGFGGPFVKREAQNFNSNLNYNSNRNYSPFHGYNHFGGYPYGLNHFGGYPYGFNHFGGYNHYRYGFPGAEESEEALIEDAEAETEGAEAVETEQLEKRGGCGSNNGCNGNGRGLQNNNQPTNINRVGSNRHNDKL